MSKAKSKRIPTQAKPEKRILAVRVKRMFTVPLQLNGEPITDFDDGLYCPIDFGLN